jgi:hypothetical protein
VIRHATQYFMNFITQVTEIVFNIMMMMMMMMIIIIIIIITGVNIGSMPYMSSVQMCIFWNFFGVF